jgi:multiple sugar transport system ATP-binding protein
LSVSRNPASSASNRANRALKVRDKLRVAMRPSRLHVFDAKTEAAI